jgi:hypothetical protein
MRAKTKKGKKGVRVENNAELWEVVDSKVFVIRERVPTMHYVTASAWVKAIRRTSGGWKVHVCVRGGGGVLISRFSCLWRPKNYMCSWLDHGLGGDGGMDVGDVKEVTPHTKRSDATHNNKAAGVAMAP